MALKVFILSVYWITREKIAVVVCFILVEKVGAWTKACLSYCNIQEESTHLAISTSFWQLKSIAYKGEYNNL